MPPLVSVISCALNQGEWVRRTVPLIRQSLGDWPHEIIIVDDQSVDGCCTGLDKDVLILRTETRFGVSASRRLAVKNAKGDIYLFTDPHCQYPELALRDLVELTCNKQAICLPKTKGKPVVRHSRAGGFLTESDRGLKVSYARPGPAEWPALLGTIYCVQKPIYEHLGGWPELPGCWGYSEQALSLMAWFSGVPIFVDERHICNHQHYHPQKPDGGYMFSYRVSMVDQSNNGHWIHAAFFPATYHFHWAPMLKKRFRDAEKYWNSVSSGWRSKLIPGARIQLISKFREEIAGRAVRSEQDFYEMVLKKPMPREIPEVDEEFLKQQRRRSKPKDYGKVQRRQSRAVDWFMGQIPGCIKGRKFLDLGSRDGFVVDKLTQMGTKEVLGVELVPETAKHTKEVLGRNVMQGDMRHLPFEDGKWHCVTCIHTLEHIPDPENGIREMLRVLMRGGWFLIVVPVEGKPNSGAAHNCCFPDEESLKQLVGKFAVDNVRTEIKGLSPKPQKEILLAGRKKR